MKAEIDSPRYLKTGLHSRMSGRDVSGVVHTWQVCGAAPTGLVTVWSDSVSIGYRTSRLLLDTYIRASKS